ncbi:hypothetical protein WNY58_09030 [Neptuniibacter pectenicola]|jgi:hypothetical protein|uniref:Uncharacterized protein n=1 Tax=Neptuniibacter pectenicola TaxID=1806669 RepID=A0ABU9TS32_9GAMM
MWSLQGRQVVHQSGLVVEVTEGSFSNPMDLAIKGGNEFAARELALLIREGIDFATRREEDRRCVRPQTPKRPILKLKRE